MSNYVKFISETTIEYPPINKGETLNYNLDVEQLIADGYKEFVEAQKNPDKIYEITYTEEADKVIEVATEISNEIEELKASKIYENDSKRNEALYRGVEYRGILFDSDIDQKINLLTNISTMSDEETINWFGMNNEPLKCTKEDLKNINSLVVQLHSFCWARNAELKSVIQEAKTKKALNKIVIDYTI